MRLLILGGTCFIGPHEVRYALSRGHHVTIFNRGQQKEAWPAPVEELLGDRNGDLKARCDPLFHRLDDHARRIRADAATALADDGRAGGGRRHAAVRYQHSLPFRGNAVVLADALGAFRDPPSSTMKIVRGF
jgi:nucleoside-diphosphate-sugar epimerase